MKKIATIAIVFLSVLMLISMYPTRQVNAANGPRSDLDIVWYTNSDTAFTALQNDEVDMIQWALTNEQKVAVEANPNLQIASYVENGMMEFDLNNNLTILDYPTSTNPCHVTDFRRFLSRMTNKAFIVAAILLNTGSRIDAPVCYPQYLGWVDPSVVTYDWNGNGVIDPSEDNYPYPYSVTEAVNLLCDMGFSDTDANGYLNYPNDAGVWMDAVGRDTTEMPLKMCIRSDHAHRHAAGRLLVAALEGDPAVADDGLLATSPQWAVRGVIGGDLDTTDGMFEQPREVLNPIFKGAHNYHLYTGGWSVGRFPVYLGNLFHSGLSYPYGSNYVSDNAHPAYDKILENLWSAANIAEAQNASKWATNYHISNCVNIPLWSYTSYLAWRKELAGVVNMKGYGVVNDWTFLNAWRVKTSNPLRFAVVQSWDMLNILYSHWLFDYALLERVYDGLIAVNPYDLANDIPWAAQDWEVGTWIDPRTGTEKTTATYYLRKDVGATQPQTGDYAGYFTVGCCDFGFTTWYNYAFTDSWQWGNFMAVHHTEIVGSNAVKVYFDDASMWLVYAPTYPLLGPRTILEDQLCDVAGVTFTGADLAESPPGYFEYKMPTPSIVHVKNATVNGVPIYEDTDFYVRTGFDVFCHNVFVPLRSFAPSDVIVINYYFPIADGAGGTYLGANLGYDWTDTMYAYGTHYPVSISSTSAALNKNPYFFWEEIPKGEIDFRWNWVAGSKPRKGYFKIDILDVVKCTGSYCTRGDGTFNPVYMPGADLDDTDVCHVGILDLVTITGKYAQTFGTAPTNAVGVVGGTTTLTGDETIISATEIGYRDVTIPSYESYHGAWFPEPGGTAVFSSLMAADWWAIDYCIGMDCAVDQPNGRVTVALKPGGVMRQCLVTFHLPGCQLEHIFLFIW